LSDTTLIQKTELEHLGPVTDASYSPDNKYLVACDANRKVILYAVPEYKVKYTLYIKNNLKLFRFTQLYTFKNVVVNFARLSICYIYAISNTVIEMQD